MRRRLIPALALVWTAAVAGCDDDTAGPPAPDPDPTRLEADWSKVGSDGHLYLQVNTDGAQHHEVFRVDLATGDTTQVTDIPGPFGVSTFSVSRAGLVVAQAPDLVDELARLTPDGELDPVPSARGSAPDISNRGDIAALRPVGKRAWELMLHDHGTQTWRRLGPGPRARAAWLDPSTLAVFTTRDGRTTWRRLTIGDGRLGPAQDVVPGRYVPADYGVRGNGRPLLLLGGKNEPALLWVPGRPPERLPPVSHRARCLSPDGRRALLTGRGDLAVLSTESGEVDVVGEPGPRILGCAWVEERFGPD